MHTYVVYLKVVEWSLVCSYSVKCVSHTPILAHIHKVLLWSFLIIKILVLYYQTNSNQNNSQQQDSMRYLLAHHYKTWNLSQWGIVPEPAMAFLLIEVRKMTAGIQLKQGLANKFCETISKWHLKQDKLWTFAYSSGLEIWEVFETIFLEDFNFASSPGIQEYAEESQKGYLKYNGKHFTTLRKKSLCVNIRMRTYLNVYVYIFCLICLCLDIIWSRQ